MYSSKTKQQLAHLVQQHKKVHAQFENWDSSDSHKIDRLSKSKKVGWKKVLSSVATTEAIEAVVMTELKKAFEGKEDLLNYISAHQLDEERHHTLLNRYILNTFQYKKTKRTLSDKIVYDFFLKNISQVFAKKPVYGLGLLLFFEIYSVPLYKQFKQRASEDGLQELSKLVTQIEKDEQRHIAGVKILLSEQKNKTPLNKWDGLCLKTLLSIALLDVNMNFVAFHNRKIRKHISQIGLSPSQLTRTASQTAQQIYNQIMH